MVPRVDDVAKLKRLVTSLDQQTLPTEDFEVVLNSLDGEAELTSLDALAAHRPNVKVVRTTDAVRDLLSATEGDFVLAVAQDETLFPSALARLYDFAEQRKLEAVVGRVVEPENPAPTQLWTDQPGIEDTDSGTALGGAGDLPPGQLFVRRDAAQLTDTGLQTTSSRIGVLGSHAVTLRRDQQSRDLGAAAGAAPAVTVENAEWREGSLHLSLQASAKGSGAQRPRAVLQLTHADTQETFLVPAEVAPAALPDGQPSPDSSGDAGLRVEAAIAPTRTPEVGQQLDIGIWQLRLVVAVGLETMPPAPIPWSPCPPALIGRSAVVPAPGTGSDVPSLTLDVGPIEYPLLSGLDPAEGTVTESVVGSELTLGLPQLHVFDSDGLDGFIALGKMRLPARIRVRDGGGQLVALVTGLAGNSVISAQFGPGPLRPTGLSLQITGVGAMSLIKTPPPAAPAAKVATKPAGAPKPAAKKASSQAQAAARRRRKKKVEPPRTGLVADLRRAVPAPLEPAVKRLASISAARSLYRRLTR
jgi:hypothetical protein